MPGPTLETLNRRSLRTAAQRRRRRALTVVTGAIVARARARHGRLGRLHHRAASRRRPGAHGGGEYAPCGERLPDRARRRSRGHRNRRHEPHGGLGQRVGHRGSDVVGTRDAHGRGGRRHDLRPRRQDAHRQAGRRGAARARGQAAAQGRPRHRQPRELAFRWRHEERRQGRHLPRRPACNRGADLLGLRLPLDRQQPRARLRARRARRQHRSARQRAGSAMRAPARTRPPRGSRRSSRPATPRPPTSRSASSSRPVSSRSPSVRAWHRDAGTSASSRRRSRRPSARTTT